jgi:hypothetical protein
MADNRKNSRTFYFWIAQGLRGCYMPDSSYVIACKTRRELKNALQWEADSIREAFDAGCSKSAIAWLANAAWKARKGHGLPYVAPYGNRSGNGFNYCFALQVAPSCKADFKASQEESN